MLKAIGIGTALSLALQFGVSALHEYVVPPHQSFIPMWLSLFSSPMNAVVVLVPGFLAGWLFPRRGVVCGMLVGFLGNVISSASELAYWSSLEDRSEVADMILRLIILAFHSTLIGAAAGAWGQLVRSNNIAKSDAAEPHTLG